MVVALEAVDVVAAGRLTPVAAAAVVAFVAVAEDKNWQVLALRVDI